jgi:hypothetical protein
MKGRAKKATENKDKPGFIFLEIDGLAEMILRKAIENGTMPTLSRWVSSGTHKIKEWETDFSSQTGASQAGHIAWEQQRHPCFPMGRKRQKTTRSYQQLGWAMHKRSRHASQMEMVCLQQMDVL